jgi:hypothetical protein
MYKLELDSFYNDFNLIGISATIEGFKIAYLINKKMGFNFSKCRNDVMMKVKNNSLAFEIFKFHNQKTRSTLYLVQNKSTYTLQTTSASNALFDVDQTLHKYLINSHKQAEYLIKIEDDYNHMNTKAMVSSLNEIPQLVSAFEIPFEDIKSPENLIFE